MNTNNIESEKMKPNQVQQKVSPAVSSTPDSGQGFFGLGIAPKILEILDRIKFKTPTPIQQKAIPIAIEGKDLIGIAQTGTGKTHAFAIPMVQQLAQKEGVAIVLAPTRELAVQIDEAVRTIAHPFGIKTACLIGGVPIEGQVKTLRQNPRIVIATPGRLLDHMSRWNIVPQQVSMVVIDEADRMLDMGFAPQVEQILKFMPKNRQTILFSATMPPEIMKIVTSHMKLPAHVEIAPSGTTVQGVTQELYIVKHEAKTKLLGKILAQYHGSVLLFSRTKRGAHKIAKTIRDMRHRVAEIHSDKSMGQRREALEGFKSGRYRILVATDIASRGIDVTGIEVVINFDLPDEIDNYVHRIGRTARAGRMGRAISFATPDQSMDVKNIEQLIRKQLPVIKHPEIESQEFDRSQSSSSFKRRRPGSGSGFKHPHHGHKPSHGHKSHPGRFRK